MNTKKYAQELPTDQQRELETLIKTSPTYRVRQRAHAILLSSRGYAIESLSDIFSVHRNTISEWIDAWDADGVSSLEDAPRSGRPLALTPEQQAMILTQIDTDPRSINQALSALKKRPGRW